MEKQKYVVGQQVLTPKGKNAIVVAVSDKKHEMIMQDGTIGHPAWQYYLSVSGVAGNSWFSQEEVIVREIYK